MGIERRTLPPIDTKLAILRDRKGRANEEPIALLRQFEPQLETVKGAVALGVTGSASLGYYDSENKATHRLLQPDVDFEIFFDSSIDKDAPMEMMFFLIAKDKEREAQDPMATKLDFAVPHLHDVNPDGIAGDLQEFDPRRACASIATFAGKLIVGKRVPEYRQRIGEILKSLPDEKREEILGLAAFLVTEGERRHALLKIPARTGGSKETLKKGVDGREKLF